MSDKTDEIGFSRARYLTILDLQHDSAEVMAGRIAADARIADCQRLTIKLFVHAATIYYLRHSTQCEAPFSQPSAFYDFTSTAVITRSILETYLTMFEVFFETDDSDKIEFRHALWLLAGYVLHEKHEFGKETEASDPELQARAEQARLYVEEQRDRIRSTDAFRTLTSGQQADALRGKRYRDWSHVAQAAGFGEQHLRFLYGFYSGFTHADGLSGNIIVESQSADRQIRHIENDMLTVIMVLSKAILNYADAFPESLAVCESKLEAFELAKMYSEFASQLG